MGRYDHNPFIQCLPSYKDDEELVKLIRFYPDFNVKEMTDEDRYQACNDIMYYYEPLTRTLDFFKQAFNIIREGYHIKTPPKLIDFVKSGDDQIMTNVFNDIEGHIENISHILNFTIIGDSGTGKSKCVEKLKAILPKSIYHKQLVLTQVPVVHIECPNKASPKQIMEFFFIKLDSLIKSNYREDSMGMGPSDLMEFMRRICIDHMIGCIIIDEIHNIKANTDKEIDGVMKFIKTLSNILKTPTIYIGTSEAEDALFRSLQSAIRMQGVGSFEWMMYESDDEDWNYFLESLWSYQVLKKPGEMTEEIKNAFKEKTLGIIRLASVLHLISQQICLRNQLETITVEILDLAEKDKMFATEKMVVAVKESDFETLKGISDLNPLRSTVYQILKAQNEDFNSNKDLSELKTKIQKRFPKVIESLIEETILVIQKEFPDLKEAERLAKIASIIDEATKSKKKQFKKVPLKPKGEIISIVSNYEDSEERYQILSESGIIERPSTFINI